MRSDTINIDEFSQKSEKEDELLVNGITFVFYSYMVLNEELTEYQVENIKKSTNYTPIDFSENYIEKIFDSDELLQNQNNHIHLKVNNSKKLIDISVSNGKGITPTITHHMIIFAKRIILFESVLILDKRGILLGNTEDTKIENSLNTEDILKIITDIRKGNCSNSLSHKVKNEILTLLEVVGLNESEVSVPKVNIPILSVQIWDIVGHSNEEDKNIIGLELAKRYELELSAILLCHNERLQDGLWKKQSSSQVSESYISKADDLIDHTVLRNQKVCVEISQIDNPRIQDISRKRIYEYHYDSTSIFLWGYLIMIKAGCDECEIKADKLYDKVAEITKDYDVKKSYIDIKQISVENLKIYKEFKLYNSLATICQEERHRNFIMAGTEISGLLGVQKNVDKVFVKIKELFDVMLAMGISNASIETRGLLEKVEKMSKQQGKSSERLGLLSIILAFAACIPLADYFVHIFHSYDNPMGRVGMLVITIIVLAIISFIVLRKQKNEE